MKRFVGLFLYLSALIAQAETWHFGLIGDVPYSRFEREELPRMLSAIADRNVSFLAHIGDFKHGREHCDDSLFEDRLQMFNASRVPFVFVPGDNEWMDCHRVSNGSYDPLERLSKLRSLFWHDNLSLGQKKIPLHRQPGKYVEHSRFQLGPVLFVTLNLPGGDNNIGLATDPAAEFLARNPVVLSWMTDSFALARREKLAGIVLLFQANPEFKHFAKNLAHGGFREFLQRLLVETESFPGQVVVVHGDTHFSRVDQPLRNQQGGVVTNFTRVETHGYPLMGWTLGVIDTASPTLFRFEPQSWPPKSID